MSEELLTPTERRLADEAELLHRALLREREEHTAQLAALMGRNGGHATSNGHVPPAPENWLEGTPMDPAAVSTEPLAGLAGFPYAYAGAAVLISGPTGAGRSSLVQACAYDATSSGTRVAYLGSEVTPDEFNARARDLATRRDDAIDEILRERLAAVRYLDLTSTITHAWQRVDDWIAGVRRSFDAVLIDPLSSAGVALSLDFDDNPEFLRFYDRLVQPLTAVGVCVVMLDNIGHSADARGRAKGASAKQDRADVTVSCRVAAEPAGLILTTGKVRSVRAPFKRGDAWTFDRETQRITSTRGASEEEDRRPTTLMRRCSDAAQRDSSLSSRNDFRRAVRGKNTGIDWALDELVAGGYFDRDDTAPHPTYTLVRPFAPPSPHPRPGEAPEEFAPSPPSSKGGRGAELDPALTWDFTGDRDGGEA